MGCFKKTVLHSLISLEKRVTHMSDIVDSIAANIQQSFSDLGDALTNIAADEATLLQKIEALIAASGSLSAEDLEKLVVIVNAARSLADRTKALADAVPDAAPPPA